MKNSSATGSLTGAIELEPQARASPISSKEQRLNTTSTLGVNATTTQDAERGADLEAFSAESQQQPPSVVAHALEKWNEPSVNITRLLATFWSFVIMGANDAAYGVSTYQPLSKVYGSS